MRRAAAVAAVLAVTAAPALAQVAPATCDAAAVERARVAYDREVDRAGTWNLGWTVAYGVFAVAQVGAALIEFSPGREFQHSTAVSLYAGAGKALLGMGSRLVLPLRLPRVAASGDACTDAAALDRARAVAARKQRNTFWLQLGGGMALHVLVGGYLVIEEDAWRDAAMSLAIGVVVSGVTLYTLPKDSWWHRAPLVVTPAAPGGGAGLAVVGQF